MKGYIYRLKNELGEQYVGSTFRLRRRISEHKCNPKINMNCMWYWEIIEEDEYESETKLDLRRREVEIILENRNNLKNKQSINSIEELKEKKRLYDIERRKKINLLKYDCECGGSYLYKHKSTHEKTKKHTNFFSQ